ncbi:flagellar hook-basal body complex protein FliE [Sphingomonas sp. BT-65]|uniref:flagellar hook-basal body complex protein FliE n=1 Tax=Sphingomonas sp. BT-65 TaxID=2989821 RepID=UPI0022357788|nr:flagellar hook-basal body complex protein FliE [Sphingomonas sp. BT-65]MCW4463793.1 flagellar hook-basal body complex protein FliE [Sphingomonas sp. BT-65]
MSAVDPVAALSLSAPAIEGLDPGFSVSAAQLPHKGFGEVLMSGLRAVDAKLETAEQLVQRFAVDDSIPVHQVTIALEQARLSVELAMQVRTRLVEGYRELMNMQL